jgi:hypothetical protein
MTAATERTPLEAPPHWAAFKRALAWLSHPVSIASIAVLVLNDHLLKETFGTWWTGKLSDFAGLVFFPALLAVAIAAVAPRARHPRVVLASIVATGVGFTWVKATTVGATTASAVWSEVAGPSVILRDVTDLVALPMLGLATFIAFRAKPRREVFVATIVVPFAVVATVATGAPPSPSAEIIADDPDGVIVVIEAAGYYGESAEYQLLPDGTWQRIPWPSPTYGEAPPPNPETSTLACHPEQPDLCFRPLDRNLGVEISHNAGATWTTDWELSDAQYAALWNAYGITARHPERLSTHAVVVMPFGDDFEVIAANGVDGIAVRDRNGEWSRVGWEPFGCCSYVHTVDLALERQEWRHQEALAWPVAWAVVLFVVAFAVWLLASPRAKIRSSVASVFGVILMTLGLGWAALALLMNNTASDRVPGDEYWSMIVVINLGIGLVPAFCAAFMVFSAVGKVYWLGLGSAALTSLLVGLVVNVAPDRASVEALTAVGVFAICMAALTKLERRLHRRVEAAPPIQA